VYGILFLLAATVHFIFVERVYLMLSYKRGFCQLGGEYKGNDSGWGKGMKGYNSELRK
jgi:hypothetical protein